MRGLLRAVGAPIRLLLLGLIRLYRLTVSPLLGGRCRFHPSCSAYAEEAVRAHGAGKGLLLAVWRVARCSPLGSGGPDPVPEPGRWRTAYDGVAPAPARGEA